MLSRPVSVSEAESIGRHLALIGQPVRIRLIEALDRCGEMTVQALALEVGVSMPDASQHLGALRRAGVVKRRPEGRYACYALADRTPLAIYARVAAQLRDHP